MKFVRADIVYDELADDLFYIIKTHDATIKKMDSRKRCEFILFSILYKFIFREWITEADYASLVDLSLSGTCYIRDVEMNAPQNKKTDKLDYFYLFYALCVGKLFADSLLYKDPISISRELKKDNVLSYLISTYEYAANKKDNLEFKAYQIEEPFNNNIIKTNLYKNYTKNKEFSGFFKNLLEGNATLTHINDFIYYVVKGDECAKSLYKILVEMRTINLPDKVIKGSEGLVSATLFNYFSQVNSYKEKNPNVEMLLVDKEVFCGVVEYLVSSITKEYSILQILYISVCVMYTEPIKKGILNLKELIHYLDDVFKKKVTIKGFDFSFLFDNLDYHKFVDCVVACLLLAELIVQTSPETHIELDSFRDSIDDIVNEKQELFKVVSNCFEDRLYFKSAYFIRQNIKKLTNGDIYEQICKAVCKKNQFEDNIIDYSKYDFVNFEIDPEGNGFTTNYVEILTTALSVPMFVLRLEKQKALNLIENTKANFEIMYWNVSITDLEREIEKGINLKENYNILGNLYFYGVNRKQNFNKALKYFKLALNEGNSEAALMLTLIYLYGLHLDYIYFDYNMYAKYLGLAYSLGNESAKTDWNNAFLNFNKRVSISGKYFMKKVEEIATIISFEKNSRMRQKIIISLLDLDRESQNDPVNVVASWKFKNSSLVCDSIRLKRQLSLNKNKLKLFSERTNDIIFPYKKYVKDYDSALCDAFNRKNKSDNIDELIKLTDIEDFKITGEIAAKIADIFKNIFTNYEKDDFKSISFDENNSWVLSHWHNEVYLCWAFLAIDLGYIKIMKPAFESIDGTLVAKNEEMDAFFEKVMNKNRYFSVLKAYKTDNEKILESLVKSGFYLARCILIDICINKNNLDRANYQLCMLKKEAGYKDLYSIYDNINFYFENAEGYNIKNCLKYGVKIKKKKEKEATEWHCYVATCVYNSYDCPQVWRLRRYRDNYLAKHLWGRIFIKIYYLISPTIVKWFGDKKWFRIPIKRMLDKKNNVLEIKGYEDTPYYDPR